MTDAEFRLTPLIFLQVTESDMLRAGRKATQNPAQYPAELGRIGSQSGSTGSKAESLEPSTVPRVTARCEGKREGGQNRPTGVDGNRHLLCNGLSDNGLQLIDVAGDAESDVTDARDAQIQWLVEHWLSLPESTRDEIVRLAEAAG